jgi:hypothetical protein
MRGSTFFCARCNEAIETMARPGDVANLMLERDQLRRQLEEERAAHKQTIDASLAYADKVMAHTNKIEQLIKPMLNDISKLTKGDKAAEGLGKLMAAFKASQ